MSDTVQNNSYEKSTVDLSMEASIRGARFEVGSECRKIVRELCEEDGSVRGFFMQFTIRARRMEGGYYQYQLTDKRTGSAYGNGQWYPERDLRAVV